MSILIKGMEMPKNCEECRFLELDGAFEDDKWLSVESCVFGKKSNCPLVEIPAPHGRLVEEHYPGELKAKYPERYFIIYYSADEDTNRFILEEE